MKKLEFIYFGQLLIASSDYIFLCLTFCLVKLPPTDQALGARAGALLQARVRGQSRRAVLRQAPDPLRAKHGGISSQRFGYCRRRGFLAQKFNRRTNVEPCTKVQPKNFSPAFGNTLLSEVFILSLHFLFC